jgi:hypothetical protein
MQFGSIQPGEFLVQGQAPVNIAQAHYMVTAVVASFLYCAQHSKL